MNHENCRELLGELSEYLDGEACSRICEEIERHMAGCDRCRVVVDTLRKTVSLYRALPDPPVPEQAMERLYKRLDLSKYR